MTTYRLAAAIFLLQVSADASQLKSSFLRKQISVDEGHVSYEVRRGSGPALILVPGSFNGSDQWAKIVQGLDEDLTLVLVEVRGHGHSWPPPENGSIEQFAQDVVRIADAEKLDRFYVGGHSIGGMIALEIGRVSPQRTLGILSLEGWTHHQAQKNAFPNDRNFQRKPEQEKERLAERERGAGKWTEPQRKRFAAIWRTWDGRDFLKSTDIPILELYGDRALPRPTGEALLIPNRPNIQLQWIAGVSHSMTIENPRAVAAAMSSFLQETELRRLTSHMLDVPGFDGAAKPQEFSKLPKVQGELVTVYRAVEHEAGFNMHPYIAHFDGRFWAMWSSNRIRDLQAGQHIRYATSKDGIQWSEAKLMMPREDQPAMRYFARGFWVRDRELYALAAHDEAVRPLFGPGLKLLGYRWNEKQKAWDMPIVISDNTINNFPPKRLANGEWMMSRRDFRSRMHFLIGGKSSPSEWTTISMPTPPDGNELSEPAWWTLPDGRLVAGFRDAAESRRLYRSISTDSGRTWSPAIKTDFPDATAKFNVLRLSDGRYVMASNPNTAGVRIPMCLSVSEDGLVFRYMGVLRGEPTKYRYEGKSPGYAGYHYPQVLEHGGSIYVIHAENMEDIKLVRVPIRNLPPADRKQ